MKVLWTQNALDHLVNIYEHIALNSPLYARGMVDKLTRRSEQIADYPFSGRMVPLSATPTGPVSCGFNHLEGYSPVFSTPRNSGKVEVP